MFFVIDIHKIKNLSLVLKRGIYIEKQNKMKYIKIIRGLLKIRFFEADNILKPEFTSVNEK